MIVIVTTETHKYTHAALAEWCRPAALQRFSYWKLFRRRALPYATYIFTDFDRLSPWELELAAKAFRVLESAGCRVLNDPGRFRRRHAFLQLMHRKKINDFRSWSPELDESPGRFPVFLRTQAAHRGVLAGLLHTPEDAQRALQEALTAGHPLSDLHFVEYAAEPTNTGIFRKLAAYRIGDTIVPALSVHSLDWIAKYGAAVAEAQQYEEERELLRQNPYGKHLMSAFEAAGIDYGRADFGIVGGKPQIYEINTNPMIGELTEHWSDQRLANSRHARDAMAAAVKVLDSAVGKPAVRLDGEPFATQFRRDRRRFFMSPWMP
ncbi:hypothetical protein F2P47_03370 [Parvibaculum sedimenti]|uniref:ATP-grasp domain-containing protein n=1 Tax=Parvibaculum sedimenti TaxID=2608632 RepID=A0A6N6VLK7_9HYPH|nr:hypothetical protein [Parvibaculum sedimenti]KAB7742316.1 hypothetical protein F2P47_03370 [Parvibaculum sedimenti]